MHVPHRCRRYLALAFIVAATSGSSSAGSSAATYPIAYELNYSSATAVPTSAAHNWSTPAAFHIVKVGRASVTPTGLARSPSGGAITLDQWWWEREAMGGRNRLAKARIHVRSSALSFLQLYGTTFAHIVFDTLPKVRLCRPRLGWLSTVPSPLQTDRHASIPTNRHEQARASCPWLLAHPGTHVLVTSALQRDLVNLTCSMPLERYVIVNKTATTTGLLIPIFLPRTAMGLSPPASLPPLGGTARGTKLVYIPRAPWVRRSVQNEEAVVAALREVWAPGRVDVVSDFASVDDGRQGRGGLGGRILDWHISPTTTFRIRRPTPPPFLGMAVGQRHLKDAAVVVGPHGGGMGNMVFAPEGTRVIEFIPPHSSRPCFMGLAVRWYLVGFGAPEHH